MFFLNDLLWYIYNCPRSGVLHYRKCHRLYQQTQCIVHRVHKQNNLSQLAINSSTHSYCQFFSSFSSPTINNVPTLFCWHSFSKTVCSGSFNSTGLIGSFHYFLVYLLIISPTRWVSVSQQMQNSKIKQKQARYKHTNMFVSSSKFTTTQQVELPRKWPR